jgi:hypothetical protein
MKKISLILLFMFSGIILAHAMQYCVGVDANGNTQAYGEGQAVSFNDNTLITNCSFTSDAQVQDFLKSNPTPDMQLRQAETASNIDALTSAGYLSTAQQTSFKTGLTSVVNNSISKTTGTVTP